MPVWQGGRRDPRSGRLLPPSTLAGLSGIDQADASIAEAESCWREEPERALKLALGAIEGLAGEDSPRRGLAHLVAAEACVQLQRFDDALQLLIDGWEPSLDVSFHRVSGMVYSQLGHVDAALEAFEVALRSPNLDAAEVMSLSLQQANAFRRHGLLDRGPRGLR